ncbi:MAG: NAD(P)/FAD-dependent oxidoreductase [Bacillota bacterium]|jgi:NADPH-dependent 2,4-dienoyl-CoA reductase/sulfur reductase-like enzyme
MKAELVIIGGGPAGMGAALEAHRLGVKDILIIERDFSLGGILQQCIHNGFGLHLFGEELTGGEYAQRFIDELAASGIRVLTDTMVLEVDSGWVRAVNTQGVLEIEAGAIILAMGCRERTRGAINIPGTRPAGIYTAGAAQRLINMEGFLPGRRAVILGSGDIGLIMARRLTLEGAKVEAVAELMPWSNGLARNIAQCLDDFDIPLLLSHTVVDIHGSKHLEGVTLARVDEKLQPLPETRRFIPCDLLLLSVGLIPENELSRQLGIEIDPVTNGPLVDQHLHTSVPGIFACGNVVHVHDLVDFVTLESRRAASGAVAWLRSPNPGQTMVVTPGENISYVVPQRLTLPAGEDVTFLFRVKRSLNKPVFTVSHRGEELFRLRRPVALPAEMVELKLPAGAVPAGGEISIQCRGEER